MEGATAGAFNVSDEESQPPVLADVANDTHEEPEGHDSNDKGEDVAEYCSLCLRH